MTAHDRELQKRLEKLENIDARLAQHDKVTRYGLIGLAVLGTVLLVLLSYVVMHL